MPNGRFLFGLDDDCRGQALHRLIGGRVLPHTALCLTPGSGSHRLFWCDKLVPSRTSGMPLINGLELMGLGGSDWDYSICQNLVLPPSRSSQTGREYVWLWTPRQGIADAPTWLLWRIEDALGERLRALPPPSHRRKTKPVRSLPPSAPAPKPRHAARYLVWLDATAQLARLIRQYPVDPNLPGSRNKQFCRLMGDLVAFQRQDPGLDDNALLDIALSWWEHNYLTGSCTSPPDRKQAERQLKCNQTRMPDRTGLENQTTKLLALIQKPADAVWFVEGGGEPTSSTSMAAS